MGLTADERHTLLRIARGAIERALSGVAPDSAPTLAGAGGGALGEPRGAFVTLHTRRSGELRGCIGYVEPLFPLAETVARAAVAAALHDDRFERVGLAELPDLVLEVSVLSRPAPIRPEDVRVGTHGLVVRCAGRGGLLLPQVPGEHGWDRETFLDHTCRKAGLPAGSWRRPDAELLGFTAEVFGEPGPDYS